MGLYALNVLESRSPYKVGVIRSILWNITLPTAEHLTALQFSYFSYNIMS